MLAQLSAGGVVVLVMTRRGIVQGRGRSAAMAVVGAALAVACGGLLPAAASASDSQMAIVQQVHDAGAPADPQQFVAQVRALGATVVRVIVPWAAIAPAPRSTTKPSFNATDPNSYPVGAWAPGQTAAHRSKRSAGLRGR